MIYTPRIAEAKAAPENTGASSESESDEKCL
jgi:hypothetical protein